MTVNVEATLGAGANDASEKTRQVAGGGASLEPEAAERISDALLDQMRQQGDPPADRVIEALFADREVAEARHLLRTLVMNDAPPPDGLPPEVLEYLRTTERLDAAAGEPIEAGQQLFAEHGPLILMCLAHYSLPAAYAAAKGVQVLHRTAYLEKRPAKRLFETTQMVIDVMTPGGLAAGGRGVRAAQKVRLMHAMVRHLIQNDPAHAWDPSLGVPINQEDLAGTLMTFSWITLDGLAKLSIHPSARAQGEYLAAWRAVGRLMGVDELLLPATVAEAERLTRRIQERQIAPSQAGKLMTQALLEMVQDSSDTRCLKELSAALMRHFLPEPVADFLGVPKHRLDALCVDAISVLARGGNDALGELPAVASAAHHFSLHFIQWMVNVELNGRSAPFVIPEHLRKHWRLDPNTEPSFWKRLSEWLGRRFTGLL